ncbi:MAG: tetratricopeptide repeat protein [Spirochaetaceae bacterium]|nr:tetratricopeptide repeat protein [Spirochaetaceae bacterium]
MSDQRVVPNRVNLETTYRDREEAYYLIVRDLARKIEQELSSRQVRASIRFRVKAFENYFRKFVRRRRETKGKVIITDILGIRIICPFLEALKEIETIIKELFSIVEVENKGDIYSFKEFGYDSTHILIKLPVPEIDPTGEPLICAEIQLRTILQDAWAEVEHELIYKAGFNPFDKPLRRKLAAVNANLTLADIIFQEIRDYQRKLRKELQQRQQDFSEAIVEKIFSLNEENEEYVKFMKKKDKKDDEDGHIDYDENSSALSLDDLLLNGLLAHNNKQYKTAIKIYTLLLEQDNTEIKALVYVHRGLAYFAESFYLEALNDFNDALEINSKNAKSFYLRGVTHRMLKNFTAALDDLNKAISLDPYQPDFWFAKAQLYFHSGDYLAARQDMESALKLDPESKDYNQFMRLLMEKI